MNTLRKDERQLTAREDRMWPRIKCDIETRCAAFPDQWSCKIVDLSERGVGIVSDTNLKGGVIVDFIDPRIKAQVVWSKENRSGLKIIN
jgi:hypothetical protein